MKSLVLFTCLAAVLNAEVVQRHLDILEGGTTYRQTVTIDYDKNIQIVEVPAHNHIVHSKTIFDFNTGKLVESHPESKTCYVRDIPEKTADLKTFDDYLRNKNVPLTASKEKVIPKAYKLSRKMNLKSIPTITSEIIEECSQSEIYETIEVPINTPVRKEVEKVSVGSSNCDMPNNCIWQTCYYSTDSCYWTVECQPNPHQDQDGCDIYHSQVLHHGDIHIHCDACFNLKCPGCTDAYNNPSCSQTIADAKLKPCIEDPTYGDDCDDLTAPHCKLPEADFPKDSNKGVFQCSDEDNRKGYVAVGHTCPFICNNGDYAGMVTCAVEQGPKPGPQDDEGVFDVTLYNPEKCH